MENKEDDIEDLFRERFDKDEAPVSPRVWQNIKNTLPPEKNSLDFFSSPHLLLWSISGLLVTFLAVSSFYYLKSSSPQQALSLDQSVVATGDTILASSAYPKATERTSISGHTPETAPSSNSDSNHLTHYSFSDSKERKTMEQRSNEMPERGLETARIPLNTHNKKNRALSSENDIAYRNIFPQKQDRVQNRAADRLNDRKDADTQLAFSSHQQDAAQEHKEKNSPSSLDAEVSLASTDHSVQNKSKDTSDIHGASSTDQQALIALQKKADPNRSAVTEESTRAKDQQLPNETPQKNNSTEHHASSLTENRTNSPKLSQAVDQALISEAAPASTDSLHALPVLAEVTSKTKSKDDSTLVRRDSLITLSDSIPRVDSMDVKRLKDKKQRNAFLSRISIDGFGVSLVTGAVTKAKDSSYAADVQEKNKKDGAGSGNYVGFLLRYKINEKFSLSAGIVYSVFTERYRFNYNVKKWDTATIENQLTWVEVDSINHDIKVRDRYSFLSVPLQVSYTFFTRNKLQVAVTPGIQANILLSGVTYLPNEQRSDVVAVRSGFNSISFSYLLALEGTYRVGNHLSLLARPILIYGASSIHSNASGLHQRPYGAGVTVGLRFNF